MTDLLSAVPARHHPAGRFPVWAPAGCAVLVGAAVGMALWVSAHVEVDASLHDAALFGHLASLVVGFGAVLSVDWVGLLWALRQRELADVLRAARTAHLPIWGGYAGLVLTGMLLSPDLSSPMTWTKLALVIVIGWNGLVATALVAPLGETLEPARARRLHLLSGGSVAVSQLGWWGTMLIGFLNAR